MRIHHRVLYPSNAAVGDRTQRWWDAWHFTVAVKQGRFSGKGFCHFRSGFFHPRIDNSNPHMARYYFGQWLLSVLKVECPDGQFALVPVPSTDAVVGNKGPFRHLEMLTDAVRGHKPAPQVADVLRFTEQLQKASQGGPRNEDVLCKKLVIEGEIPDVPLVLIDDVVTSGGHMKAAKTMLEEGGGEVVCGVACGKTTRDLDEDPWKAGIFEPAPSIADLFGF